MLCFSIEEPLGLFDEIYDKPWTRLGPYIVGMCAGWILCKTNCTIKMHKVRASAPLWVMSTCELHSRAHVRLYLR
jgi:hypothetical protein